MSDKSVNFKELLDKMTAARVAEADRPTILGGRFTQERLDAFLGAWRERWDTMPWRIWEYISEIEFADVPKAQQYLQRAEVFGEGGHLSLRRDGNRWLWHYIGPSDQQPPAGFDQEPECEDFWTADQPVQLRRYADQVILWGERKPEFDFWWDDRVAAAKLVYPVQNVGRVYLDFWRYTQDGRTVFVWYRQLSPTEELGSEGGSND